MPYSVSYITCTRVVLCVCNILKILYSEYVRKFEQILVEPIKFLISFCFLY